MRYNTHAEGFGSMLKGKRILLVEDEAMLAMALEDMLTGEDATVIGPAASLEQALTITREALRKGGLDAAVLDINIAGQQIWPVMELLRSNGVPVVVQTGYTNFHSSNAPVLHKPYSSTELVAALDDATTRMTPAV